MPKIPSVSFEAVVRSVEHDKKEDKFSVSFATRPAFYWVNPDNKDTVELLKNSHKNKSKVVVEWNPVTLEVTRVAPL